MHLAFLHDLVQVVIYQCKWKIHVEFVLLTVYPQPMHVDWASSCSKQEAACASIQDANKSIANQGCRQRGAGGAEPYPLPDFKLMCYVFRQLQLFALTLQTVNQKVGLPTKTLKLLRFHICCTRTKHLSEIYKNWTIKVGAAKLLSVDSSWT